MEKKKKLNSIKEIIFIYLAASKILYWFNTIFAINANYIEWLSLLERLLTHDIPIIITVIILHFYDKLIFLRGSSANRIVEKIVYYGISYFLFMSVILLYALLLNLIFQNPLNFSDYLDFAIWGSLAYVFITIGVNIKIYFKTKEKKTLNDLVLKQKLSDKLSMLETLNEDGDLFSQEEYEVKRRILENKLRNFL